VLLDKKLLNNVQQYIPMDKRFTRDSHQKKQSIYTAFTELVNENGYEKLTARQIAKRANISVGTIYHYFKEGKPAIAASLYEKNLLETHNLDSITGYQKPDLKAQVTSHLEHHKQNKELYRAFDQAIYSHSEVFSELKRKRDEILSEEIDDTVLLQTTVRIYVTVDALIHRHLFVEPLFESEEELIEYLTTLAETAYIFIT